MSSSNKGKTDPQFHVEGDDGLIFPVDAELTDDTPTIISKSHPTVDPKPAASPSAPDVAIKASADNLGNSLRGRRLAHFELIEPIGVGGMAAVLRARDTQLDREVALKILPPEMAVDPENVRRFHQEARAAARLDHPNIARVFFCGEDQGLHFIAFEFVEGQNIRTLLERGRLPVHESVRYVLQVATGLEHAAARGVVHRDVKPSNIIVGPNGHAKLVDMGLARSMERQDADLTQSGVTLGTFDYISPEQALEPRDADARSDIYSLGCTFYHMLTGVPPVPEGTAAKKLHHHQHIAPVDPRQLNPEIPDDVAMILSRMMEKDPRRRYQRPLQLVQHLMQVARKVGAADDLPEGVLFVDAPLPAAPRSRPAIIIALPFLALAVLIALLALKPADPQSNGNGSVPIDPGAPVADQKDKPPPDTRPSTKPVTPIAENLVVTKAKDLEAILRDPGLKDRKVIQLSDTINLADMTGFGFTGSTAPERTLTFKSGNLGQATLAFDPGARSPSTDGDTIAAGLTITGGTLIFENLVIVVKAKRNFEEAIAAIAVHGAAKVTFVRCQFEQEVPGVNPDLPAIASVLIEAERNGLRGPLPRVEFRECCFKGKEFAQRGQTAVAVNGPANIRVTNCGFRPHAVLFQMRRGCQLNDTALWLDQCSAFVFDGWVFGFEPGSSAALHAQASLFAGYEDKTPNAVAVNPPDLIHQLDGSPLRYSGAANCYANLNALWSGTELENTLAKFKAALKGRRAGSDDSVKELLRGQGEHPWHTENPLEQKADQLAFQVQPEFEKFGIQSCYWGKLERAAESEPALLANQKLYDPDYKGKSPRIFTSLSRALSNLDKDDTLFLKPGKDRRAIELPPTVYRDAVHATIRAWANTAPVVKLAFANPSDVALFRLQEGKLRFEGLHFLLEARSEMTGPLSLLRVGDNVQASFERCVFTLKAAGNIGVAVVSLIDAKERMMPKSDVPQPGSRVQFVNCFIRGDGDLANLCACRRLQLSLENSLVAVAGSLFDLDIKSDDMASEPGPQLELKRSSIFSREPVFSLSSTKAGKGLGRIHVEATACLFAALAKRPLVYLKAPEVQSENQLGKYLDWKGEQNAYARFDNMLESERPDEMGRAMELPAPAWGKVFGEPQPGPNEIALPSLSDLVLAQARPDELRPSNAETPAPGVGSLADLDSLLRALEAR